jgi:hypothetical protein
MATSIRRILCALILFASLAEIANAQSKAYTLEDISDLLRGGVPSGRVLKLAQKACISFEITPAAATAIRSTGGDDVLVAALRSVCYVGAAKPKVIPSVHVTPTPTPKPIPAHVTTPPPTRNFRYSLVTRNGESRMTGELSGAVPAAAKYYSVDYDASGRMVRIRTMTNGRMTFTQTRFFHGSSPLPDSVALSNATGEALSSYRIVRDAEGNRSRVLFYNPSGAVTSTRLRILRGDSVESIDSTAKGTQSRHAIDYFSPDGVTTKEVVIGVRVRRENLFSPVTGNIEEDRDFRSDTLAFINKHTWGTDGLQVRTDYYYANGTWVGASEFQDGLESVVRYKWPGGESEERRRSYDSNRRTTQTKFYHNEKFICTFTYDRDAAGTVKRTLAVGPDGALMAEYPGLYIDRVGSDGRPPGSPTQGVIQKTGPWW